MKTYIYKAIPFQKLIKPHYTELDIEKLNEIGAEGWQFVTLQSGQCIFMKEVKVRTVRPL